MRISIFQPDIPQNLGALLRVSACLNVPLDIIEPCGFPLSEKKLKRTAMDYVRHAEFRTFIDYQEIEKMVSDAEANAEEDKKFEEIVQARNAADTLIHGCKKTLEESADKVEENEKSSIEEAIKDLEEALKGEDKDLIEEKTKSLADASSSLAQRLYAEQQANADGNDTGAQNEGSSEGNEDVVDADFEEVKEEKK